MSGRARCELCRRPERTCFCRWITAINNCAELVILQHPLEVNNAKNTARLLHLSLHNSQLHVGEIFAHDFLHELLKRDGKTNLLLYPATPEARAMGLALPPPAPDPGAVAPEQIRLLALDGTWRKSRKLLYLNPLLQQLPRLSLVDCPASAYLIRKAQGKDELSTLEASCYALQQLEAGRVDYQPLLNAFDGFIAGQSAFVPKAPGKHLPEDPL